MSDEEVKQKAKTRAISCNIDRATYMRLMRVAEVTQECVSVIVRDALRIYLDAKGPDIQMKAGYVAGYRAIIKAVQESLTSLDNRCLRFLQRQAKIVSNPNVNPPMQPGEVEVDDDEEDDGLGE